MSNPPGSAPTGHAIWYVAAPDGSRYGPLDQATLDRAVAAGQVTAQHMLWQPGWPTGRWAGEVFPALQMAIPAYPPAYPPQTPNQHGPAGTGMAPPGMSAPHSMVQPGGFPGYGGQPPHGVPPTFGGWPAPRATPRKRSQPSGPSGETLALLFGWTWAVILALNALLYVFVFFGWMILAAAGEAQDRPAYELGMLGVACISFAALAVTALGLYFAVQLIRLQEIGLWGLGGYLIVRGFCTFSCTGIVFLQGIAPEVPTWSHVGDIIMAVSAAASGIALLSIPRIRRAIG